MKNELLDGWEWKKLGDISKAIQKIDPKKHPENSYIYLDIDSVDNEINKITNAKKINGKNAPSRARQIVTSGDILFSTVRIYLKNIALIEDSFSNQIASTGFCVIRPSSEVNRKFLFYYIQTNYFMKELESLQKGANYPAVRNLDVLNQLIPVPPLETQHKIVAILEKAEETKKLRAQADKLTQQLLQSVFLEMFGDPLKNENGWKIKELQDVCNKITDGTHHSPLNKEEGDVPYITAKNITKNGFNFRNLTHVSKEVHEDIYKRCNPEIGDVLYIKDGVTTGIALVNTLEYEFSLLSSVALLKPSKDLSPYYLSHLLNLDMMYKKIRSNMGGAAITRLTIIKIKKIKIPIPPIELQNKFAEISQQVEKTTQTQEKSSQELESLFNALMQKAFTGDLIH